MMTRQNSGATQNIRISGEKSIGELNRLLHPVVQEEPTLTCQRLNLNVRDSYTRPRKQKLSTIAIQELLDKETQIYNQRLI